MTTTSPAPPRTIERFSTAAQAERLTALATPAARLLLVLSSVMAVLSVVANLASVDDITDDGILQLAMHASTVPTLIFSIVAGLYSSTTDLRFGLMDQRLLSEPNRTITLLAKVMTAVQTGFLYGLLGAITAVAGGSAYYSLNGESFDVGSPLVRQALLGVIIAAPLFAVLGVAIGMLVGNQPLAIGGTLAWLLIIEPVAIVGAPDIGQWLPGAAGIALTNNPGSLMGQVPSGLLLLAYAVVAVVAARQRFQRTDL